MMNPDGSERTQLTFSDTGSVDYESLTWSPDSTRIAYTSGNDLWVVDTDTANATNLTRGAGGAEPAWSPDSTRIAFTRGNDLWVVDTDTANASRPHPWDRRQRSCVVARRRPDRLRQCPHGQFGDLGDASRRR